jgi:hypothetical protein
MFNGTAQIILSTTVLYDHTSSIFYAMAPIILQLGGPLFLQRMAKPSIDIPAEVFSEGRQSLAICTFGNALKQLISVSTVHSQVVILSVDTHANL